VKVLGFLTRAVLPDDRGGLGEDGRARVPGSEPLTSEAYQMERRKGNRRYEEPLAIMTSVDLMIASASSPRRSFNSSTASRVMTAVSR